MYLGGCTSLPSSLFSTLPHCLSALVLFPPLPSSPHSTLSVTTIADAVLYGQYTYEALIWEYSFNVPHDSAAIIQKMGGEDAFVRRLDASFVQGFSEGSGAANTAGTYVRFPFTPRL